MKSWRIATVAVVVLAIGLLLPRFVTNAYVFYAGFITLQYVVISTGWNILGGYAGYVNFGSGAFVGLGAYAAVFLFKAIGAPLWLQMIGAGFAGGLLGLGMGYLTLRIQGVFFSIATLALTIVLNTDHRQLELRRRRARRNGIGAAATRLVSNHGELRVLRHAGTGGDQHRRGARDRAILDRPWPCRAARR